MAWCDEAILLLAYGRSDSELQEAILEKMRRNGSVTDYMLCTVRENTHIGSLICWVKSFI